MDLKDLDLMDPQLFSSGRAPATFEDLRQNAPVHWQKPRDGFPGFWVVSRYHDVVGVLRDPETFSSEYGNILPTWEKKDPTAGIMTFTSDPPQHVRLRTLLMPSLKLRSVKNRRPAVAEIVSRVLADVPIDEPFDFMELVANRLPIALTCGLLGVPADDFAMVVELSHRAHATKENDQVGGPATEEMFTSSHLELLAYFAELVASRRKDPQDDIISSFAHTRVGDDQLSDEEIAVNCFAAILGGYQADKNAQGGAMLALIRHPDQFDLLASRPSIMPSAVEEIWRWTTPTLNLTRVAVVDTEIAGVPIAKQDRVSVSLFSANRDPVAFDEPYEFRLTRYPNRHLAFGSGNHFCAGANVARMEMSLLLDSLLKAGVRPVLTAEPTPVFSHFQQGLKRLPVKYVRR
ncbi:cytochrome P450 [Phytohabitans houttuyneae]|uniref:Cytochrome P450 n=1 Tax=Phytohabitans houttuyneae TaxID=1076126 RepID=A0A6V8K787_9ACTN|nr:cytochrome P450 [Phytohabitans houttuyneae]GFJ81072.1 cytochrome P450 [Phytohabitans houttuyneae]